MADVDSVISFFHGPSTSIEAKIQDETINGSDFVVGSDNDALYYIDKDKSIHELGSSKLKKSHTVQLGENGEIGGLKTNDVLDDGMTFDDFVKKIITKRVPAAYTQPTVTVSVVSGNKNGDYEVGTIINTTINAIFTKNDGGDLTKISINRSDQPNNAIIEGAFSPLSTSEYEFSIEENSVKFTATATHEAGSIKLDNLGDESPFGKIEAGVKTSNALVFTGKRNAFYGTGAGDAPEFSSSNIRALSNKILGPSKGKTFEINVPIGQQYIVFAIPTAINSSPSAMYVETNDTGAISKFVKSQVDVNGANDFSAAKYDVWVYSMSAPAAANMTFKITL